MYNEFAAVFAAALSQENLMRLEKSLTVLIVVAPFLAVIYAIYTVWMRWVTPPDVGQLIAGIILSGLGITVGYHRLATHRAFVVPNWLRAFWYMWGSMAVEGGVISWARTHEEHHAKADKEGDPHSPLDGFIHAHLGWMLGPYKSSPQYAAHLNSDALAKLFEVTFLFWVALSLLIPFAIGGWIGGTWKAAWMGLLWGGLVRVFFVHHITWSINSVCHTFGSREFETKDVSRNNFLFGVLGHGEGWHNNHHAFPRSAFHGLRWWQFDMSGYIIRFMELVGLATEVYRVPVWRQEEMKRHLLTQRGS